MAKNSKIPILKTNAEVCDEMAKAISMNAFRAMTEALVKMEFQNAPEKIMMEKCVWPVLEEAGARFSALAEGDSDVPLDGFEYVIG